MRRRGFLKACAGCAICSAASVGAAAVELKPRMFTRTRLVDERRQPLRAASLAAGRNYIFHYPFEGTPCFLINLGKSTEHNVSLRTDAGGTYRWPGGTGPQHAIVAYCAICTHRMTYPTRQISFISYRERSSASAVSRPNTIHCCSEHSEYDPASGARVLNGPAPQPLAAILLEYDPASDGLHAVGTLGADLYNAFFAKYELKLQLDYGGGRARQRAGDTSVVSELSSFCKQQVRC
jgi:arsenite oxidase small subunit